MKWKDNFFLQQWVRDNWRHTKTSIGKKKNHEESHSVRRNNIESHKFYVADGRNPKKKARQYQMESYSAYRFELSLSVHAMPRFNASMNTFTFIQMTIYVSMKKK